MSADPKNAAPKEKAPEQNALAAGLGGAWSSFKQGKLVSYKVMAIALLVVAGLGLWWYIAAERRKAASKLWVEFEEANSAEKLNEIANRDPKAAAGRVSALLVARAQLGPEGIDQLNSPRPELRGKAVENIGKAREAFAKLLEDFKDDPVFKAECLLGLAKAEAALVGVPAKENQLTEFRGQVPKVIEYLDQLAAAAAPDTPWATDAKKLADELRKDPTKFETVQRALTGYQGAGLPKDGPLAPTGPAFP